jgi:hypothetical protein
MNRNDIINLAHQAGVSVRYGTLGAECWIEDLERFATLVAAAEQAEKQEQVSHQGWCASLTQLLLSDPPQPAPCNCTPPAAQREWVAELIIKEKNT